MSSKGTMRIKQILPKYFKLFLKFVLFMFVGSIGLVLIYGWVPVPVTPLMFLRTVQSIGSDKMVWINKDWVPLEEISPHIQRAVLKAEDNTFFEHSGFDYKAIRLAIKHNRKGRGVIKGGSTISQQTAKNVFLWPSRSWVRKGFETYFTILMEATWSKERILEVYLNVIELGSGVYGVEAASQKYFKKPASKVTRREASLIAAVLPNPRRFRIDRPSPYVYRRQLSILKRKAPELPKTSEANFLDLFKFKFDKD